MEGLFKERLQVRTRHLEQQVRALTKQLASHKQDNALLLKSHSDAAHKVQALEGELKRERERCHKLSATLSSCRTNVKKKVLRSEEADCPDYDNSSRRAPGNVTKPYQCRKCSRTAPFHDENPKEDENYQLLPNYMNVMPARLNHKLMKSKNTSKNVAEVSCCAGQAGLRRSTPLMDPSDYCCQFCSCNHMFRCDVMRCADCCRTVEICRTCRLPANDHVRGKCSTGSGPSSKCISSKQCWCTQLHCLSQADIACEYKDCPSVLRQQPGRIINPSATSEIQVGANTAEQDLQPLTTLSAEGFYVRMQTAKADPPQQQQQQHGPLATGRSFDRCVNYGDEHIVGGHFNLWSVRCMEALKAENKALRGALLSSKNAEIQVLESELQDIKECALGAGQKVHLSSDKSAAQFNAHHGCTFYDSRDLSIVNGKSQVDPIKFLDSLHSVEDRILQKKVAILGLECGGACADDHARVNCANYLLSSHGVHVKTSSIEDVRHHLKAGSSEVVLLRRENQRLKDKCSEAAWVH